MKRSTEMRKMCFILIFIGIVCSSFTKSPVSNSVEEKLNKQVDQVKKAIQKNPKYNKEIAFFIDMGIMSGKNRFFVYDLRNNKIIDEGLVAHGLGSETGVDGQLIFSNTSNSLSTSLGKYSIGNHYKGKFGKAYKLYGLDKTNSNAFNRSIVLHKYAAVPYEQQDKTICHSFGCPMVNVKYFERIEKIIDNSESNIMLSIYY